MAAHPSPADSDTDAVTPKWRSRRTIATFFWSAVALVLTVSLLGGQDEPSDPGRAPYAAPASPAAHPVGKHLPRSRPTRLLIPKISVDAPFTDLAIGRSGQLQPPPADDTNLVGWYAKGVSPGETGTSIIAGHVDTATSAAVFANLGKLEKGDRFQVARADGRQATFVVDSAETFDKDDFPNDRVYADTPRALVRLITCAGDYDRAVKDYTANLVVFAHLA
ncbi:class F sortase [Streptomyces dysideae]|uniref:class F sortase n=1 Tax=Streptomyces dysideae TaxID=909626 RepID=UPI00082D33A5|nr:class F sortase [Streptomyces dysideae]